MSALRPFLTLLALFALTGASCGASLFEPESEVRLNQPPPPEWTEMLTHVNAVRSEGATCGSEWHPPVPPLSWNEKLARASRRHVEDMLQNDHFDHHGTDGSSPGDRAEWAGYRWVHIGENIARGHSGIDHVMEGWLGSPSHCAALMDPAYVEIGAYEAGRYWDQMFGRPR